jgi:hypothetical protein
MNFAHGEQYSYSNSGYILLGAIIEKVTGQSYAEFIQTTIFDKLGMKNSFYGRSQIILNRAKGYQGEKGTYNNASYISLAHAHAAGALLSTVDVLAIGMECVGAPYTWLYGSLNKKHVSENIKNSRRLNGANAAQAYHMVDTFKAKQVYLYSIGMEPWYKYFMGVDYNDDSDQIVQSNKMIEYCEARNIPCERLVGKKEVFLNVLT